MPALFPPAIPAAKLLFKTLAKTLAGKQGRLGCYTSHVRVIQKALQENHFPLIILEDDAVYSMSQ
jgi:GR25 family glycosyltransferase involved in LPS biosynthesis